MAMRPERERSSRSEAARRIARRPGAGVAQDERTAGDAGPELGLERWLAGRSAAMQRLRVRVLALAPLRVPVLVRGEPGSGRRALVRALHALGRGGAPGAELVHVPPRGEPPGALDPRRSYHLEEVVSLAREEQARWSAVLQRVEEHRPDAPQRVFASSTRDLDRLARDGAVDPALARRLLRFTLALPPLRDRREDVPALARVLADRAAERLERRPVDFTPQALRLLTAQSWPGNVHELARAVEKLVAFCAGPRVTRAEVVTVLEEAAESVQASRRRRLGREREELVALIDAAGGNLAEVARRLRMSRGGVIYRAQKFGLLPKRPH